MATASFLEKDLTSLALRAAVELDAILRDSEANNIFRSAFAKRLRDDVNGSTPTDTVKIALSPTTAKVVATALQEYKSHKPSSLSELQQIISEFAADLEKDYDLNSDSKKLDQMKSICLKLHRQLLAEKRFSRLDRRSHSRHW